MRPRPHAIQFLFEVVKGDPKLVSPDSRSFPLKRRVKRTFGLLLRLLRLLLLELACDTRFRVGDHFLNPPIVTLGIGELVGSGPAFLP